MSEGVTHVRPLPATRVEHVPHVNGDGDERHAPRAQFPLPTVRAVSQEVSRRISERAATTPLGLPEHLTPREGGLYPLISQLESLPAPHLPPLRSGDEILVATLWSDGRSSDQIAELVATELADAGRPLNGSTLRVEPWPAEPDERRMRRAAAEFSASVSTARPRLVLIHTTPDCPPTLAYVACRSLTGAQLDLWDTQTAERPAAALAWGTPVAFVDGRQSSPELWAAVCAARLAGDSI